jgi:hypothetical protein
LHTNSHTVRFSPMLDGFPIRTCEKTAFFWAETKRQPPCPKTRPVVQFEAWRTSTRRRFSEDCSGNNSFQKSSILNNLNSWLDNNSSKSRSFRPSTLAEWVQTSLKTPAPPLKCGNTLSVQNQVARDKSTPLCLFFKALQLYLVLFLDFTRYVRFRNNSISNF